MLFAGVDIGGTTIKIGMIDEYGEIHAQYSYPTKAEIGKDASVQWICDVCQEILAKHPDMVAFGLGCPGVVNPHDRSVYYPPNLVGWDIVPLAQLVETATGKPAFIDNDANAAAIAELEVGAGAGLPYFLYITLGTGVGGGIVVDGKIFSGERGGAGEVGHIVVDIHAEPQAGQLNFQPGTLEELLGRKGLIAMAKRYAKQYPDSYLNTVEDLDVKHISEGVERNDPASIACFTFAGKILGLGIASILHLFDMRIVIIGGGVSQAHPIFLDTARATLKHRAMPTIANEAEIRLAKFGSTAGIVGAAMLAKHHFKP